MYLLSYKKAEYLNPWPQKIALIVQSVTAETQTGMSDVFSPGQYTQEIVSIG